ncbi:hypothetical protein FJZ18_00930 [Candidatus Pacearchaeota archaeon]|nr:hypothetical protein [Candidatus Pacearchaeota archaeon]
MRYNYLHYLLLCFILLEIILTATLNFNSDLGAFCLTGSDCSSVQNSEYGKLFGVSLSVFGFIMFSLLLIIYLYVERHPKYSQFFLLATGLGFCFAVYFLILQFFVLKKICSSCVIIDGLAIVLFIIALFWSNALRRELHKIA